MTATTTQLLLVALLAGTAGGTKPRPDAEPDDRVARYIWPGGEAPDVGQSTEVPESKPRWIVHEVIPHEKLADIAVRYGVSVGQIMASNKLPKASVRARQRLRIYARRVPPPRKRITYTSKEGDTWASVAVAHGVGYRQLRGWNWRYGSTLRPNREMAIWVEQESPITVYRRPGPPMPEVVVPEGGESVRRPQRGKLVNGVRIPETALFELKWPDSDWGSTHAVRVVLESVARFRHDSGWRGRLVLSSMSRRHGRRFRPHHSHQSGRDIDVYLPLAPGVHFTYEPNEHEVDWYAAWALALAFLESGEIECMYLDRRLHRRLYEAGRQLGATPEQLAALIEWPNGDGPRRGIPIRHGKDHYRHFHVRIRCGPGESRCRSHPWADRVPRDLPIPEITPEPSPLVWQRPERS